MLILSRKIDESIVIDEKIKITIAGIDRGRVKLGITCDKSIPVRREELPPLADTHHKKVGSTTYCTKCGRSWMGKEAVPHKCE